MSVDMKIVEKLTSRERCAEAGWHAFDLVLDEPMDREFIMSLRPLGSFVFLEMLSRPFFKIESDYFIIKGLLGDPFFRMAVHGDHTGELTRVMDRIGRREPGPDEGTEAQERTGAAAEQ